MISLIFLASGCEWLKPKKPYEMLPDLIKLEVIQYPDFSDDMDFAGLKESIIESISYLEKIPKEREFTFGEDVYNADYMLTSMKHFISFLSMKPSKEELKNFVSSNYLVYQSKGHDTSRQVLFTGYYEPELKGNRVKSKKFNIPLHSLPEDLITIDLSLFSPKFLGEKIVGRFSGKTVLPYYERREIISDVSFSKKAKPLAWVKDPVECFFLHIQGSGKIIFPNGNSIQVGYSGSNGRPYRSVGKYLADNNKIPLSEMSMQAIRSYLKNNPDEMETVLNQNPSYVFFKVIKDGPLGCIQAKLIPGRSIATDRKIFPLSAIAFIETQKPLIDENGNITNWQNMSRFVLNQDTGGAIKGPGRVDVFFGSGNYAEIAAGHLKHPGKLYFLIEKRS